jgi:DnaJ-domain-containing protein 1
MPDYFALFDEPRQPWLEVESLQQKFIERSATVHPDRVHTASEEEKLSATQRYAELNAAHACLRESKNRLLHLIELETGAKPADIQRIPPGTMDLFVEVGQLCQGIDQFIAERSVVTAPMLKVQMFQRGMEWLDRLNALQERIAEKRAAVEVELQSLNAVWQSAPPPDDPRRATVLPLERLEQLYRLMSFITRWTQQLQDRAVQVTL